MSAIGTKQTSISALDMSAFRWKADIKDCHAPRMQGPREPARQGKVGNVVLWAGNVGSWRLTESLPALSLSTFAPAEASACCKGLGLAGVPIATARIRATS